MHTLYLRIVLVLFLILLASIAGADESDVPVVWELSSVHSGQEVSLVILPDGSGPDLTQAMIYGGDLVDATISVRLISWATCEIWIANFPYQDMWLSPTGESWRGCYEDEFCWNTILPDDNTSYLGETEFRQGFVGGGWSMGPLSFYLNGAPADDHCRDGGLFPPIAMRFNSPDINADLEVNLIDVVLFTRDFFGEYHYRSDFIWDGEIDLLDLAVMAQSQGVSNPYAD